MTCIAGVVRDGHVYIGGDSAGVEVHSLAISRRADEKVFRNGPYLMGFAGSFRVGQLMRYALQPYEVRDADPMTHLVTEFVPQVIEVLTEAKSLESFRSVAYSEGVVLIGYAGRLFTMEADFQIGESREPFAAIGCGADLALGSLYASQAFDTGRQAVQRALRAAEAYSAGVRSPFVVKSMRAES